MTATNRRERESVEQALAKGGGVLRLDPAWVARDFPPPGYRLAVVGLKDDQYDVGERGHICERWFASTTKADNRVGPPDEGLSYVRLEGEARLTLKDAVAVAGDLILGPEYAATHAGLGRLFKIYDFGTRIPYHLHPPMRFTALLGRNPKEEAYYFPQELDMGRHPETFFGVHPSITELKQYDVLLPYLVDWNSDLILMHSRAYLLVAGEGFHLPTAIPHAPGTAVTLELQEDSDVGVMLQARVEGLAIPKDALFKEVRPEDRVRYGERIILDMIDWELSGDPYFYEHRHLSPVPAAEAEGVHEDWIFYNTTKFSGKRLVIKPGCSIACTEKGVHSVLIWKGKGRYAGHEVEGGNPGMDELLIGHECSMAPHLVENTGPADLEVIKFFGPDINSGAPMLPVYPARLGL